MLADGSGWPSTVAHGGDRVAAVLKVHGVRSVFTL